LLAPNLVATARHCVADVIYTDPAHPNVDCATTTFSAPYAASAMSVSNSITIPQTGALSGSVSKIVVPTGANTSAICGNDIALLILADNVNVAQYVQPAIQPSLTDHTVWAKVVTAIGYGVTSPADVAAGGTTAGTRRIKQNIALTCIPNDPTMDCLTDPALSGAMTAAEFLSGDGTCEGDSGSGAFDQTLFNAGTWASFGVLSYGSQTPDGQTCIEGFYTRFDAWAQLLVDTANEAASAGGYSPPAWATGGTSSGSSGAGGSGGSGSGGSSGSTTSGSTTGKVDGTTCGADLECSSASCVSLNGTNFVCASACTATSACSLGASCNSGYCFTDAPSSTGARSGCAVAPAGQEGSGGSGGIAGLAAVVAAVGTGLARRRRRGAA
jgi:hypothetical protein